ncbi:Uncharacterised protein [Klebsiella pneumoniae]|nr:Uncharacterised protein [Klebsiella pneumoniae]
MTAPGIKPGADKQKAQCPKRAPEHGAQHPRHLLPERPVGHEEQPHRHHADRRRQYRAEQRTQHSPSGRETARRRPWQQKEEQAQLRVAAGAKCPFHM